jgi:predicted nucleic acid-binding protein
VLSIADVLWIESPIHNLAYALWLSLGRKNISFVDCISFIAMRQHGIETSFAFDRNFQEQGFDMVRKGKQ